VASAAWPLRAALAAFTAGAFLGIGIDPALALCVSCAVAALACGAWPLSRSATFALACAAVGILRGGCAPRAAHDAAVDAALLDPVLDRGGREPIRLEGVVAQWEPVPGGMSLALDVDIIEPRPGDPPRPTRLRALLRVPSLEAEPGARLRVFARLREPPRALNPGERDAAEGLSLRGIAYLGSADLPPAVLLRGPPWSRAVARLRARFARRCEEVCTTRPRAGLVAALGVGDRSLIPPDVEDDLSASGLVHLLASAGLHLAAVAFLVRSAARRLWLRSPWAGRLRAAAVASLCAVPVVAVEVALLGAPWPAVRAGIAAGIALGAVAAGRRADGISALLVAAALCAAFDPAATRDLALQLSLAGVGGMLLLSRRLRDLVPLRRRTGPFGRAVEEVVGIACASAAATLCTAPLLATAFHRVSLVSVAANAAGLLPGLVAIPLASFAAPLDAVAPSAALPLLWAADHLAGLTLLAAQAFAAIPCAVASVPAPGIAAGALFCAGGFLVAGYPARFSSLPPRTVRLARAAAAFGACALVALTSSALGAHRGELRVTFLAVGQGDAAVVQLPGGGALLVDGGGDLRGRGDGRGPQAAAYDRPDPAGRIVLSALAELGIRRLDAVVLTHPHPDHAGGLFAVLDRVPVRELWTTGEPGPGGIGDALRARGVLRGVKLRVPGRGEAESREGVRIEVLRSGFRADRSANDNSMVLRLVHGEVALLLAGDVEALAEAELAQSGSSLRSDLLKAGHHGSATSSTEAFLSRVRPAHVVFSVGAHNPFGFPSPDVAARARAAGARTRRTDAGAVRAVSDGRRLTVTQL
jgi:competence protein ComEC